MHSANQVVVQPGFRSVAYASVEAFQNKVIFPFFQPTRHTAVYSPSGSGARRSPVWSVSLLAVKVRDTRSRNADDIVRRMSVPISPAEVPIVCK